MKGLFIFLGGAILGSAITYKLMKNYYILKTMMKKRDAIMVKQSQIIRK